MTQTEEKDKFISIVDMPLEVARRYQSYMRGREVHWTSIAEAVIEGSKDHLDQTIAVGVSTVMGHDPEKRMKRLSIHIRSELKELLDEAAERGGLQKNRILTYVLAGAVLSFERMMEEQLQKAEEKPA